MLEAIQKGITIGFLLNFSFGPIFFLLIEVTMRQGLVKAVMLDAGAFVSDLLYALFAIWGAHYFKEYVNEEYIGIIGGFLLITMGILKILRKEEKEDKVLSNHLMLNNGIVNNQNLNKNTTSESNIALFTKGFLINTFNPNVFIIWVTQATWAISKYAQDDTNFIVYFVALFIGFLLIDSIKIGLAFKARHLLTDKVMTKINKVVGVILLGIGTWMVLENIDAVFEILYFSNFNLNKL